MRGTTLDGKPDNGDDVFITSADNVQRFDGLQETDNFFYRGSAKFSVPAGHYWALATFFNFSRQQRDDAHGRAAAVHRGGPAHHGAHRRAVGQQQGHHADPAPGA